MKSKHLAGVVAGVAVFTSAAATAAATPVTVNLRVEGPTRTLVERKVTVDVRPFKFSNSAQTYTCDGTGSTGTTDKPSPTRNGALAEAAERDGFELLGTFSSFGPSFSRINGEDVGYDSTTMKFLVEYKNGVPANVGGCADPILDGDSVLFGYGSSSDVALRLAGPTTVKPGEAATFTATDESTGKGVAGATVAGRTTGDDGKVTTAALTQRGPVTFKASKTGAIRSNAVAVCVTDGADGFCGTTAPGGAAPAPLTPAPVAAPDLAAAFGKITSIKEGARYSRGRGPRTLAGTIDPEPSGIKDVRLRLARTNGKACSRYDGARERLVTTRKCGVTNARTFSVGTGQSFSYLLPSALPKGRYVLDVVVLDRTGHQTTTYQRGRNRVVFVVG